VLKAAIFMRNNCVLGKAGDITWISAPLLVVPPLLRLKLKAGDIELTRLLPAARHLQTGEHVLLNVNR